MNQKLPSPSELAEKTGLSYWGACARLNRFRSGSLNIEKLFQPAAPPSRQRKRVDGGVTAREIMDRVPGLSLSGAEQRIVDYENGARDFESLFSPKGYIPQSEGTVEWRSLGEQERLENMPVLGSWEQKQLQQESKRMNRADFIAAVARQAGMLEQRDVAATLVAAGEVIVRELLAGGNVSLPGLGKFAAKRSKKQKLLFLAFDFAADVEEQARQKNVEVAK